MKKTYFTVACFAACLSMAAVAHAQYYYYNSRFYESNLTWEIGASAAGMNCLTDLGGRRHKGRNLLSDLQWQCTRPAVSFSGKVLYLQKIGLMLQGTIGKIAAYDSVARNKLNAPGRYRRGLQVESAIMEILLLGELYPLSFLTGGEHPVGWLAPYFIAGVGYFHFNPVARNGPVRVRLQPLHTEGQGFTEYPGRKPYSLHQWNLPFGIGLKYEISARLICGIELLYRKLFTDYLDDVSKTYIDPVVFHRYLPPEQAALASVMADPQIKTNRPHKAGEKRGNPANNDAYLSFILHMAVSLGRERR